MSDIVERLKRNVVCMGHGDYRVEPLSLQAAEEIEKLRETLKPFAAAADDLDDVDVGCIYDHPAANSIDCKDLRAARAALKGPGDEKTGI